MEKFLIQKNIEGEQTLDGINFNGIEDITKDSAFILLKDLEENDKKESLNLLIDKIKKERPQFMDYYFKNKQDLLYNYNTNSDRLKVMLN